MKKIIIALIVTGMSGFARAGDIEQLKAGSDIRMPDLKAVEALEVKAPVPGAGVQQSLYNSWDELVQRAVKAGIAMHIPVPGYGTRDSRVLTIGFNDEKKPLDLFAVYGKAGAGTFEPEGLYIQRIYTMPDKILSYIFISSLEGGLLKVYVAVSSPEGSGTFQKSAQDPEMIQRFKGLKSLWIYTSPDTPAAPNEIARRIDFL